MSDMNIEQIPILFGPERNLVGVITTPASSTGAPIACLMLNMGANHRGGPHRINVKLAHRLATMGITSLRMDLAGLGDSGPARTDLGYYAQCVVDLQAGMDLLRTTHGIQRFLVVGLCSGAAHALNLAVDDPRVTGILLFDGYSFAGRRWHWERSLRRALAAPTNPAVIGKTMRWLRRTFTNAAPVAADTPAVNIFTMEKETPAEVRATFSRSMATLVGRGVSVYLLYSGTQHVRDVDRDHLGSLVREPFADQVRYEFSRDIDHTMTSLAAQGAFLTCASNWALGIAMPGSTLGLVQSGTGHLETAEEETPSAWGALAPAKVAGGSRQTRKADRGFIETVY
jgi:pimeloyl-ACP methyl ester carboxylesterase